MVKKIVCQISGGIESTTALVLAISMHGKENVYPIACDSDDISWKYKESIAVKTIINIYQLQQQLYVCRVQKGDYLEYVQDEEFPDCGFIPGMKLIFNAASMSFAQKIGANEVWIGNNKQNVYPDESNEFIRGLEELYNRTYKSNISIVEPFKYLTKAQVILKAVELGVKLEYTLSCGDDRIVGGYNCGICDWDLRRKEAFKEAGVEDPTRYIW